jgi:hypothetical protein
MARRRDVSMLGHKSSPAHSRVDTTPRSGVFSSNPNPHHFVPCSSFILSFSPRGHSRKLREDYTFCETTLDTTHSLRLHLRGHTRHGALHLRGHTRHGALHLRDHIRHGAFYTATFARPHETRRTSSRDHKTRQMKYIDTALRDLTRRRNETTSMNIGTDPTGFRLFALALPLSQGHHKIEGA